MVRVALFDRQGNRLGRIEFREIPVSGEQSFRVMSDCDVVPISSVSAIAEALMNGHRQGMTSQYLWHWLPGG